LTETRYKDRFPSALYALENLKASGLEFRYRNLFHVFRSTSSIPSTMVNNYGQTLLSLLPRDETCLADQAKK